MAGDYEKPITIAHAIQQVDERKYLLPAIQRNFTWSHEQICVLFDSIMRNYPINAFMFWRVDSAEVRTGFRFYQFLENYVERFAENNPAIDTKGRQEPFFAVIDGQQRLTSLYIGLRGTYAYKMPRKWWPRTYDPTVLPKRKLYLNLAHKLDEQHNDDLMEFDFRFLTKQEVERAAGGSDVWFEVGQILEFPSTETSDEVFDLVVEYLEGIGQGGNAFARKTLRRLYHAVRLDTNINYYAEQNQSIDHVLDIFIRTNHGGTPLSFSDLLMSITVANWEEARENIDDLVNQIRGDIGFSVNRDFVMKTASMLIGLDVKFKVQNFDGASVGTIRDQWDDIRDAIIAAFHLVSSFGLNDSSLRTKNAVIPIVYYIFHKDRDLSAGRRGRFTAINNPIKHQDDRRAMRQWLNMSLLRGVFGFAGDALLTSLRSTIREHLDEPGFPIDAIIARYVGTNRDLTFDSDFIARLIRTQKDDPACLAILALLQPNLDFTQSLHVDHLHPASAFTVRRLDELDSLQDAETRAFFEDRENWNSIANLHLLTESENTSKQAKPLGVWMSEQQGNTVVDPMIPPGTDLAFEAFPGFVRARTAYLAARLDALVGRSSASDSGGDVEPDLEQRAESAA